MMTSQTNLSQVVMGVLDRFTPMFHVSGCRIIADIEAGIHLPHEHSHIETVLKRFFTETIPHAAGQRVQILVSRVNRHAKVSLAFTSNEIETSHECSFELPAEVQSR